MARDAIEREFRNYAELKRPMRADADALVTFRAGFLAARRLAAEKCREPQEYAMPIPCPDRRPGCLVIHTVPGKRPKTAEECAAEIERIGEG